jgi:hypothetical protein
MKFLLFLFLTSLVATAETVPAFSRQPYLQLATHDSIRVVWRTRKEIKPRLVYGRTLSELPLSSKEILTRTHPSLQAKNPLFKDAPVDTRQFEATIDGLKPATTYYYAIYDGGTRLTPADKSYHFKTNPIPDSDTPVYFWVVGDSGTGGKKQAMVHDAMVKHNADHDRDLDFYIHVGDMAYGSGTNQEFSDRFFKMYEPTLRNTVVWPSMGNHEGKTSKGDSGVGPYYDAYICPSQGQAGGLPSGKEAYYSFDFGKVHFICLDSHDLDRRPTGEMAQWLKADLEKTKAEFLVAFFHHPPYTKGSHDSDREGQLIEMREYIMPILESGGVDLVFTGHSHIYERSMLIDGAYHTPSIAKGVILDDRDGDPKGDGPYKKSAGLNPNNGTISVTTGHGGTTNRRSGTHPLMRRIILDNGSCLITIKGDTITGEMLNLNAEILDTFAIHKSGVVEHTPILDPWQPEPYRPKKKIVGPVAPKNATELIAKNAEWSYLGGSHPAGDPIDWAAPDYDISQWKVGKSGFGYGDNDDTTEIDMRGKFTTLYIRREFELPKGANLNKLGLAVSYDDAFIAYLNGHEVHRQGVDKEQGASAAGFTNHDANKTFAYFPLKGISKILKPGQKNVLAIEGHNVNLKSSDFTLHPRLLLGK